MSSRKRSRGADAVHEEDIPGAKRNKDAVSDDAEMEDDGDDEEEDLEMSQLLTQDERGTTIDAEMGVSYLFFFLARMCFVRVDFSVTRSRIRQGATIILLPYLLFSVIRGKLT